MPISDDQVGNLARLARLNLTAVEVASFAGDMSRLIEYFDILQEADTTLIRQNSRPADRGGLLREDRVRPSLERDLSLLNAPETEAGYLVVPKVFDK
ncbi:MAG: Asp-tRNA(Asn)/Glu-tRNA(Gln) amidotransferase subunit GatC [Candidatus Zixiibacteriota bacterium]|nr:MAG: Asp-tRNA(Asn)/Glu-tRNA(Gln) amidotransferase subunit GatC [candidate division Zixibacteria bacterium]